ncbi:hypothetical protein CP02DC22_1081B, partial [Chlamydia psittaci 02DC22]
SECSSFKIYRFFIKRCSARISWHHKSFRK